MQAAEQVDAKKQTWGPREALALAAAVDEIFACKGQQVIHLNCRREKPTAAELKKVLLGPTGNLRAPTLRIGKTLLVGFHEETYHRLLGENA